MRPPTNGVDARMARAHRGPTRGMRRRIAKSGASHFPRTRRERRDAMGRAPDRTGPRATPFGVLLLAALLCSLPGVALAGRVSPHLDALLAKTPPDQRIPVIVELEERANPASAAAEHRRDRKARGRAVVKALRDVADRTQKPVLQALAQERANGHAGDTKAFFIFNGIAT